MSSSSAAQKNKPIVCFSKRACPQRKLIARPFSLLLTYLETPRNRRLLNADFTPHPPLNPLAASWPAPLFESLSQAFGLPAPFRQGSLFGALDPPTIALLA